MYYVYVLQSRKDKGLYTGYTDDLEKRLKKHKQGLVISTRSRKPLNIIYYEACLNKRDALHREKYLKTAWGKKFIKNRLRNYLRGPS
ncbi:GIY-YIG nuclease family protein [Patescibacteria group bacterium]|nr:GIY-YIG nuclease family protein [Patescibacteria group bacterium]